MNPTATAAIAKPEPVPPMATPRVDIVETPTQPRMRAIRLDADGKPVAVAPAAAAPPTAGQSTGRNLPAYTDALLLTLAVALVVLPLPAFIDTPDRAFKRLVVLACIAIPPVVGILMIQRRLGPGRGAGKDPKRR